MNKKNQKLIALLAALFLLLTFSFSYLLFQKIKSLQSGLKVYYNAPNLARECLSYWQKMNLISGNIPLDFWEKPVIVAFVFDISDCGICLARLDEVIDFVDSLIKGSNVALVAIARSQSHKRLIHYLSVAPKPIPVLIDTSVETALWFYNATPQIIIINRYKSPKVAVGLISAGIIRKKFLNHLIKIIFSK